LKDVKSGSAPATLLTRHMVTLAIKLTHNALRVKSTFFFTVIDFGEAVGFGRPCYLIKDLIDLHLLLTHGLPKA